MASATTPDFDACQRLLDDLGANWEPSEAHGAFCGRACLAGASAVHEWVRELAASSDTIDVQALEQSGELQRFAADSLLRLEAGRMGFDLLLPADDEPLQQRATSLADWCHGFMQGLAAAGGAEPETGAAVLDVPLIAEILSDFGEITRAGRAGEAGEADEAAYAELVEYVRVSAQLVYEETAGYRSAGQAGTA